MSQRYLPLLATLAIFIIAYIASTFQFPPMFSTRVIGNLLTDNAFLGIAAVGMTFVILSGGIDLSIGSVIAFTSIFLAMILATTSIHPLLAFAIVLVMTTAFGALMGAIIHYLDMPAFIVTLAGMFLARGLAFVVSIDSIPIKHPFYETLQDWYLRLPGGGRFTLIGAAMIVTFLVCIVIAHRTRFGANVYALGGGVATAKLMGVDVARTTIAIYAVSGLLAGLSGIVYSIYTSAGYSLATVGVELDAIAAVVIGGTLLSGGVGFVAGTFIGIAIQGLIQTYITFDGTLSSWWTKILIGILLFSFVAMQKGILLFSKDRSQKAG
ncbi:sugar ABC transporter permease YjfF [Rhizobiales bacterium RZME27]|uniref:Sugar ABC transporter permease YjfF n=1 Tax=Endobacterium cereale TaxID=2663029 RepID=A0A6A8A712_9HYPH|nr:galactofuranose ABC transporter, permease protein YjfF [Endobacterium cereale]MQY47092.1 sugar ABC transporter permease YjfF [Endobacterium cereale]